MKSTRALTAAAGVPAFSLTAWAQLTQRTSQRFELPIVGPVALWPDLAIVAVILVGVVWLVMKRK